MDRSKLNNGMNEQEALDGESGKVAALLSALPRVEAPGNFDFGVKARIAAGTGRESRGSFIPFLKVAAPLSLAVVMIAAVMFYGAYPDLGTEVAVETPPAAESRAGEQTTDARQSERGPEVVAPGTDESIATGGEPSSFAPANATRTERAIRNHRNARTERSQGGGSIDTSLVSSNTIGPPGFPAQSVVSNQNPNFKTDTEVPVREVLQTIGIEADFADGGWKVKSTVEGSITSRSGVRVGDVVEAIDSRTLSETTTFLGAGTGKTLRIRRDGKQMNLDLRNK